MEDSRANEAARFSPSPPAAARSGSVMAFWLVAMFVIIGADLPTKFDDAQKNESTSFLPGDAESTKALRGERAHPGRRGRADRHRLQARRRAHPGRLRPDRGRPQALNADLPPRVSEYSEPTPSPGGDAAIIQADVLADGESETIPDPVEQARDQVADTGDLEAEVAGGAALSADAIDVFEQIDGTLLLATGLIVLILLLAVYRSPVFWFFPFLAVIFAELTARGLGYGLTEIGVTAQRPVSGDPARARLRRRHRLRAAARRAISRGAAPDEDKHEAMAEALRRAGPAIIASGLTVIAALLCLMLADVEGTAGLGPIGAMGIGVAMVAMLTALPAFLVIPRVFWLGLLGLVVGMIIGAVVGVPPVGLVIGVAPDRRGRPLVPRAGRSTKAGNSGRSCPTSATRRRTRPTASGGGSAIGSRTGPAPIWIATVAGLLVLSLGWLDHRPRPDPGQPVPRRRRVGGGPGAPRRVLPRRRQRADRGDRARPCASCRRHRRARRASTRSRRCNRAGRGEDGVLRSGDAEPGPLFDRRFRRDRPDPRRGQGGGRRGGARRRPDGGREGPPGGLGARLVPDPADRALRRLPDPCRLAPRGRRAAHPDRDGDPLLRRRARGRLRRLRRPLRLPGERPVAAAVRLHLPGRPRRRLQHLPDGARARGDPARAARARASCAASPSPAA